MPEAKGQITTGFLSKHLGSDKDYNENNAGLGYASPDGLMFGAYLNSLRKPSIYAAKEWTSDSYKLGPVNLRGGLLGGAVTGYEKPVQLLLMPEILGAIGDHALALGLVPPIKNVTPAVLALQYRKKF